MTTQEMEYKINALISRVDSLEHRGPSFATLLLLLLLVVSWFPDTPLDLIRQAIKAWILR